MCFPHCSTQENPPTFSILRVLSLSSALVGGPKSRDPLWQNSRCNLRLSVMHGGEGVVSWFFEKLEGIGGLATLIQTFSRSFYIHTYAFPYIGRYQLPPPESFLDSLVWIRLPFCTCVCKLSIISLMYSVLYHCSFYFLVCQILLLFSIMFFITLWVYFFFNNNLFF